MSTRNSCEKIGKVIKSGEPAVTSFPVAHILHQLFAQVHPFACVYLPNIMLFIGWKNIADLF